MTLLLPNGPLHGVSLALVKQAARFMLELDSAELYDFAVSLGIGISIAEPIWQQFIADGYIEKSAGGRHVPSERMGQLPMARAGRPLPRQKAEALLKQTIENAKAVNALPASAEQVFYVTELAVFGSFLDESKQELGDLDIAWSIEERPGVQNFVMHCMMYNIDSLAPTRGAVRPKSPFVRLTTMDEVLGLKCPYNMVYEFQSPVIDEVRAERARQVEQLRQSMANMQAHMDAMRAGIPAVPRSRRPKS